MKNQSNLKVSLFVHDLASNPIVRAAPVARGLQQLGYDVEILGLLLTGKNIYSPFRNDFHYQTICASTRLPIVLNKGRELAKRASGDIIYAFKPLWTSFWPALLASGFGKLKPLYLDIEDDELWFDSPSQINVFVKKHLIRNWVDVGALRYKTLLHPLSIVCPWGKTVSTTNLQERYGGILLRHGPDGSKFNPEKLVLTTDECRNLFDLPNDPLLVLFAGSPKPYKGLATVIKSLMDPQLHDIHLVLAGSTDHQIFRQAKDNLKHRCHLLGYISNDQMPRLLNAVDVVPVIQRCNAFTQAQLPAKLLEAMAMKKTIITSQVGDLPLIVGEDSCSPRGWTVEAESEVQLTKVFKKVLARDSEVQSRRENARQFYSEKLSVEQISNVLDVLINVDTVRDDKECF